MAVDNFHDQEIEALQAEFSPPINVLRPLDQQTAFVFSSPHSGRIYPKVFRDASRLDAVTLRRSEDCYVDELFAPVVGHGAPMISALFPRAYLDVNREPYELDPELLHGKLPDYANTQSIRVVGGLGTIARIVADNEEIYRAKLPVAVALARIDYLYKPFHAELASMLEATRRQFGYAVLIDCHSMPSASANQPSSNRPDFVLGDRFGTSCDSRLTRLVRESLTAMGYDVQLNRPYAGGFITEHYGRPMRGHHALQIEINRALYLDEATLEKSAGFDRLSANLRQLAITLFAEAPQLLRRQLAAE